MSDNKGLYSQYFVKKTGNWQYTDNSLRELF
mgnify:FL=1